MKGQAFNRVEADEATWMSGTPGADALSFDMCYGRYAPLVTRWTSRLTNSAMDVDDVVQEVFCIVHRKLPKWDGQGTLSTWLFRITHHVVRNWNRKRRLYRLFGFGSEAEPIDFPSEQPNAADQMETKQAAAEVRYVLSRLPEHHRTLIVLFELEELSTAQIADLLDIKVGTVRVGLHRARAEFMKVYEASQVQRGSQREGHA